MYQIYKRFKDGSVEPLPTVYESMHIAQTSGHREWANKYAESTGVEMFVGEPYVWGIGRTVADFLNAYEDVTIEDAVEHIEAGGYYRPALSSPEEHVFTYHTLVVTVRLGPYGTWRSHES